MQSPSPASSDKPDEETGASEEIKPQQHMVPAASDLPFPDQFSPKAELRMSEELVEKSSPSRPFSGFAEMTEMSMPVYIPIEGVMNPHILAEFNNTLPDGANRVMNLYERQVAMYERQQEYEMEQGALQGAHRREIEKKAVNIQEMDIRKRHGHTELGQRSMLMALSILVPSALMAGYLGMQWLAHAILILFGLSFLALLLGGKEAALLYLNQRKKGKAPSSSASPGTDVAPPEPPAPSA